MNTMKLSQYFELIKPQYTYIKIIPDKSIRNYNSSNIAKAISTCYKTVNKRIKKEQKKIFFETSFKISYIVDISLKEVAFYFLVPKPFLNLIEEKIREIWPKVVIEEVDNIKQFSDGAITYQLTYKKEDPLSIAVDKKSNEPLNSILSTLEVMQDDDRITIVYNFLPRSQNDWNKRYLETMQKIKNNEPIDKEKKSPMYILKVATSILVGLLETISQTLNDFMGGNDKKENTNLLESISLVLSNKKELSVSTKKKKELQTLDTQIAIVSESKDITRQTNNAMSVCQSYGVLDDDNELIYRKVNTKVNLEDYRIKKVDTNTFSVDECQNFIQVPGRTLLEKYKINHIDTLENDVPQELQEGTMCIGANSYKGKIQKTYLTSDKEFKNLTLCLIGPTRSGKTTLIENLSKDAIDNKETTIVFDFCGNCELSKDVSSVINKGKVLNIDCANLEHLQGIGYNEIVPMGNNPFEVYRVAKTKSSQLMTLVNSLNDSSELQARMERYLESAALVVFISDGPIKDVFSVLQDYKLRKYYIGKIPQEQFENMNEYILSLEELDEYSKATKDTPSELIGTKITNIQGILNRINKLKQNAYMELMLKKDCSNNINLIDEMQKAQLINIKIPETMFSTEQEKDIYCTYWLTKIWGALQVRKAKFKEDERTKVNLIIDELYQIPKCQEFLRSKLSQIAKFGCKPIISCHYLNQIGNIRNELKAANASYMLISGCDKDNFNELKEELGMFEYELDDLLRLKRYHSLNLLRYEQGWWAGITKLPKPL